MLNPSEVMESISVQLNHKLIPDQIQRLQKQIEFMLEIDKLKHILRKTILTDRSREENSVEHSWHIAMAAFLFSEYAQDQEIDLYRVMKMLLVHDLVEIDAGDTYCYDYQSQQDQASREQKAAERIFKILPPDQSRSFRALWDEFESRDTPESKYANALDRFQPFLQNYFTKGQIWRENNITRRQVIDRMHPVLDGAPLLWNLVKLLIDDAVQKKYLAG
ncbi:MAG: HD domain-containing protein [Desulfobacteraceae bacterium]|nr:HD domain-containing protein [Desulfobacteraceae bacterium]